MRCSLVKSVECLFEMTLQLSDLLMVVVKLLEDANIYKDKVT